MTIDELLACCTELQPAAGDVAIERAVKAVGLPLPDDYRRFLSASNGLECAVPPDGYLVLFSTEDIVTLNADYEMAQRLPGLLLIGSDGSGEGFAIRRSGEYVRFPFMSMEESSVVSMGRSFEAFLESVRRGYT